MSDFLNKFTDENYKDTIDKKVESPKKKTSSLKRAEPTTQRHEFVEESYKDPNYKKQQRTKWVLVIVSTVILIALGVFGFIWMNRVRVIDFVNQPIGDMQTWAARNDLILQVEEVYSLDVSDNTVIEMTPVGGTTISKGDIITVVVSMGADPDEILVVPDFTGSSYMDVQMWIDEVKANNMRISYEYSETIEAENFVRINFSDTNTTNSSYQRKDYAIVYISRGPQVYEKDIEVPAWVKDQSTLTTAQAWADTNDIDLVINYVYSALPNDTIIYQSVAAESMVAKNDTITISVSKGLSVSVPDFIDKNMTTATSMIAELNLLDNVSVDLIEMYNNTNAYGTYIWQDHEAGEKIDASITKPFEMRVYYSLGKPFINSQVGSLESVLTSYFYNLNLNSAELSYSVTYKNCTSVTDPVKGQICYQSKYNEYVNTGTHIDLIVHDPSSSQAY